MDVAAAGGSMPLMARSMSPSPLWFPALQDEYFATPLSVTSDAADSLDSFGASSSCSFWSSSRTAAAQPTSSRGDIPSFSSPSSQESLVEIVGMPFGGLLRRHGDCDNGSDNELDPLGGLLRCKSHDTMTTDTTSATFSTANTKAACPLTLDVSSISKGHASDEPEHSEPRHQRRRPSRASRRALSAQDWASIMTLVNSQSRGDDEGAASFAAGEGGDHEPR